MRRLYVSALTKPEDAFARRDPKTLRGPEFDRWYCSPYVQSIAYQLQEVIPHSHAEQIRQVAQNEGTVLSRIKGLMMLITLAALCWRLWRSRRPWPRRCLSGEAKLD